MCPRQFCAALLAALLVQGCATGRPTGASLPAADPTHDGYAVSSAPATAPRTSVSTQSRAGAGVPAFSAAPGTASEPSGSMRLGGGAGVGEPALSPAPGAVAGTSVSTQSGAGAGVQTFSAAPGAVAETSVSMQPGAGAGMPAFFPTPGPASEPSGSMRPGGGAGTGEPALSPAPGADAGISVSTQSRAAAGVPVFSAAPGAAPEMPVSTLPGAAAGQADAESALPASGGAASGPYSVAVDSVPVRQLLHTLARDAGLDADIDAGIEGRITLVAQQQTLSGLLERIADQAGLRWSLEQGTLVVRLDRPHVRTYAVDYVNMSRETEKRVSVATRLATTGIGALSAGGAGPAGNDSTTAIQSVSRQDFWAGLVRGVAAMLSSEAAGPPAAEDVVAFPETGLLLVRANARQHARIGPFLDRVRRSAHRGVLVEATIVEVELSGRFRAGVDWSRLAEGAGLSLEQALLGGALSQPPFFALGVDAAGGALALTIRALAEFGRVRVLSRPRLMVLNNQTALLKVVDNQVYFSIGVETTSTQGVVDRVFETTVHTVPVGLVMSVTPGVHADGHVILNVRPSVSRISGFVDDPNPALAEAGVVNRIPLIQTRELESVLRLRSGQTAVLGGLMQEDGRRERRGLPWLQDLPWVGGLFRYTDRASSKTELLVFLRPRVLPSGPAGAVAPRL